MKHYKTVLFDLDGTLLDTSEGILGAVKYAQQQMNLPLFPIVVYGSLSVLRLWKATNGSLALTKLLRNRLPFSTENMEVSTAYL